MNESKILVGRSKTVLIIPFVFTDDYINCNTILQKKGWLPQTLSSKRHLLEHVGKLIPKNPDRVYNGSIGTAYILDETFREHYGFPKNTSTSMHLIPENKNKESYSFKVSNVHLYLFETSVGFLTYEIKHTSSKVNDIVTTNYNLKHLNHFYDSYLYSQYEYFQQSKNPAFNIEGLAKENRSFSAITSKLLEGFDIKTYFTNSETKPESALVYNFILLDKPLPNDRTPNNLGETLFQFRRSYKGSYKAAPADYDIATSDQILQTFDNSYWGVSLEGLTNVFNLTDDKVTDEFFKGNYSTDNEKTYFYIYLIALHQRYAFLELNALASDIPDKLDGATKKSGLLITELRKKINITILRSFFEHVSSVSHQQHLYELISKNLSLHSLKQNLHMELEALASIAEIESNKREKEIERVEQIKKEKYTDSFLIISTIFVIFSAITGSWTLLPAIFKDNGKPLIKHVSAITALGVISSILMILGVLSFVYIIKKWTKKKAT